MPIQPRSMEEVAAALEPLASGLRDLAGAEPALGSAVSRSQGDTSLGDSWARRPVFEAYSLSSLNIGHTADHLLGAASCIRSGDVVFSIPTLVRSGLESAAQTSYLLGAETERERVRRWANISLKSEHESWIMLHGMQTPNAAAALELRNRTDALVDSARRQGFNVTDPRRANQPRKRIDPPHLDAKLPAIMSLITDLLHVPGLETDPNHGQLVYRLCSSVAHSQAHGLRWFFMRDMATPAQSSQEVTMPFGFDAPKLVFWLTPLVLGAVSVGRARVRAQGYPLRRWQESEAAVLIPWLDWIKGIPGSTSS